MPTSAATGRHATGTTQIAMISAPMSSVAWCASPTTRASTAHSGATKTQSTAVLASSSRLIMVLSPRAARTRIRSGASTFVAGTSAYIQLDRTTGKASALCSVNSQPRGSSNQAPAISSPLTATTMGTW